MSTRRIEIEWFDFTVANGQQVEWGRWLLLFSDLGETVWDVRFSGS